MNLRKGADIGFSTGCFPAMQIACGIEKCTIFEVRDLKISHPKIEVRVQDLSVEREDLQPEFDLVTCLSTIEHIGLGRYGDPLDPLSDIKLANNIKKIVRPGGIVLMSFPVGIGCVFYNLHRIYSPYRINKLLEGYELIGKYSDLKPLSMLIFQIISLLKGCVGRSHQPIFILKVR